LVDDRDSRLSSEELLRAAHQEATSNREPGRDESGPVAAEAGGPDNESAGDVPDRSDVPSRFVVEGRALRLHRTGRLTETGQWWNRLKKRDFGTVLKNRDFELMIERRGAGGREFDLIVDGEPAGRVVTKMKDDHVGFKEASHLRMTRVLLSDGTLWSIGAEGPGPKEEKETRFGRVKQLPHRIHRRVLVISDGQRRLAWTEGDVHLRKKGSSRVVAEGTTYELATTRRMDLSTAHAAKEGTIGSSGVLRRSGPPWARAWTINTTEKLPLPVVLLHWHLLLGDWKMDSGSSGGG